MSSKDLVARSAKPEASTILEDYRRAMQGKPAQVDEVVAKISSTILKPDGIGALVSALSSKSQSSWSADEFPKLVGADSVAEIVFNSAFVRAAAKAGFVFYLGPDKRVHRNSVVGRSTTTEAELPPAEEQPVVEGSTDSNFYVEPEWYEHLKMFVDDGDPVLLIGPPGSGKSEACERVFRDRSQTLHVVSCKQSMTADDLEGRIELRNSDGVMVTKFEPSEVAMASENGHGVLLDEADAIPAHASFGVFRLLAGKDMRILRMGMDGRIGRHKDFRIVGTQNTEGRGDDRGLHHGRSYQDEAFLDRWGNVIRVGYLPKTSEMEVLVKRTGVESVDAERIVESATLLRRALEEDAIMFCCTMRRTISVAKNIVRGFSPFDAWSFSVLNRATREDVKGTKGIEEILGRVYGSTWKAKRSAPHRLRAKH